MTLGDSHQLSANGSGPRSARRWTRRWRRWLRGGLVAIAAVTGIAIAGGVLLPVLAGGPLLRYIVGRATESLCGSFHIGGGRLEWKAVPQLLRGRPVAVVLHDVRITAPDGHVVLAAAELSASLAVHRGPWRVSLRDARLARGRWELTSAGNATPNFIQAWASIPAGADRRACGAAPPRKVPRASRSATATWREGSAAARPPGPPLLTIVDLRLDAMEIELGFPAWGLRLKDVAATGTLSLDASAVSFQADDVVSEAGGLLRIGEDGNAWATAVPLDSVHIRRVAVFPDAPSDLLLEVTAAVTGRSRLSGRALFRSVMGSPRADRHRAPPPVMTPAQPTAPSSAARPGLDLDARWDNVADALARLHADWLPDWIRAARIDGTILTVLRGPFDAPSGELTVTLPAVQLTARLATSGWLDTDVVVTDTATEPLVPPALRPLLGGRLSGALRVRAFLAPNFAGAIVDVKDAHLHLRRTRRGPFPGVFALQVGRPAVESGWPPRGRAADADQTMALALTGARLSKSTLRLDGIDARWSTFRARGSIVADAAHDVTQARFSVDVASLTRLFPAFPIKGACRFDLAMTGSADHMTARLRFPTGSVVSVGDQVFSMPPAMTARLTSGDVLVVEPFVVHHRGGGTLTATGRLVFDGPISAQVRIADYPLQDIPAVADLQVPALLAPDAPDVRGVRGERRRPILLTNVLRGTGQAMLDVRGTAERPTFEGQLSLRSVRLAGRPVGDGDMRIQAGPDGVTFRGSLGDGAPEGSAAVAFTGSARRGSHATGGAVVGSATVDLHGFRLHPWLPTPWSTLDPKVTGQFVATRTSAAPPSLRGAVDVAAAGAALRLEGAWSGGSTAGQLRGQVVLESTKPAWSPWFASAAGTMDIDLSLSEGSADGEPFGAAQTFERVSGHVSVGRDLILRPRRWPTSLVIGSGGRIDIDKTHLRSKGLSVSTHHGHGQAGAQVSGEIDLDPATPAATRLGLTVTGRLDGAAFDPLTRAWGSVDGTITASGMIHGTVERPRISGQANVDLGMKLRRPAALFGVSSVRAIGRVDADGDTLSTGSLRLQIATIGDVTIGTAKQPAVVRVPGLFTSPGVPSFEDVDAIIAGHALHFLDEVAPVSVGDLDLDLRLSGRVDGPLLLRGTVQANGVKVDTQPKARPARPRAARGRWFQALPPNLTVDLTLRGPSGAVTVAVPYLPDVTADFDCRLLVTSRGASLAGRLRGDGTYSSVAVTIYDWLEPGRIRDCQLLPTSAP